MTIVRWAGLWALAASFVPGPLRAEEVVTLPEVQVPLPSEEPAPEAPERRDPTGALTVLPARELGEPALETAELLLRAPGVHLQDLGGFGQTKTLSLRGASSNGVLVLLDGIPLSGAGGATDLSLLPLAWLERLELLRGGGRYGSGALGGVVNAVTRAPREQPSLQGKIGYGSFGTLRGQLGATGRVGNAEALALLYGARTDGAFPYWFDPRPTQDDTPLELRERRNNDAAMAGALAKVRGVWGGWTTQAMAEAFTIQRGLAGTALNPTLDARERSLRLMGALSGTRLFDGRAELTVRGSARAERLALSGGYFGAGSPQTFGQVLATAEGGLPLGHSNLLCGALELGADLLRGGGEQVGWVRAALSLSHELLLWHGAVSLLPAVRVEQVGPATLLSPKLGASLALGPSWSLRVNAGQANRAPSLLERYVVQGSLLPNPDLRPERALYADAGASLDTGRWRLAATGFASLYEDLIAYEYYPPFLARPYNFGVALVRGVELEAQGSWGFVEGSAAYTLLDSANLRDDPRYYGEELPYRPRHRLNARLAAGPRWLRARVALDAQSSQRMNRAGTVVLPERLLLHAGLVTEPWAAAGLTASLELKNALDAPVQDFDGYPLPGRSVQLTVGLSLDPAGSGKATP